MATGKSIVKKDARDEHRFNLKASNGEIILSSEGYAAKASCLTGIASLRKHATDDGNFERKQASNGEHPFNLKATNGQVIGTSERYTSRPAMENRGGLGDAPRPRCDREGGVIAIPRRERKGHLISSPFTEG